MKATEPTSTRSSQESQRSEKKPQTPAPTPSPTLQKLRELIVGEELKNAQELAGHLDELRTAEHLASLLPEALRKRKKHTEEFDDLVAALQIGTESAIQRSVQTDQEPLTKALFPIMGPAIRAYVIELFRSMSEDLNRSIQNATSTERLKWRAQAKLMGKPYAEYLLLKTRSFHVEEVYLMQRHTGLLLMHSALAPDSEVTAEADVVSGMFTAIRSFVKDSFARGNNHEDEAFDDKELDSFTFGDREVLIEVGPSLVLAAVVHGVPTAEARTELKRIHEKLHSELNPILENFSGDTSELEIARPILRKALIESDAENEGENQSQGGLWRIWTFLGTVGLLILSLLVINFLEQRSWNRFENKLRAEPGIAITQVERTGWWRKRLVRGLRDPLAKQPEQVAKQFDLKAKRIAFEFGPMASMEEEFELIRQNDRKAKQQALQEKIEALESELATSNQASARSNEANKRFSEAVLESYLEGVPGLQYEILPDKIRLWGELAESDYKELEKRLTPIHPLRTIDTSSLTQADTQIEILLRSIATYSLSFERSSFTRTNATSAAALAKLLLDLDKASAKVDSSYHYTILAHPLIGKNRVANHLLEEQRITHLQAQLLRAGVGAENLSGKISGDLSKAGQGVTIHAEKND